ncbi:WXG100 family type VII secretion target [Aeromicrobium chenweiae]|uniref:ESAT-6-like protein n=1 Tax=Aeromicrobium chenweiae TaxID=2079793 RepID=A0A2S0WQI6_9ACTN|nr:WXG100 family type VII secretion target [Aeromicrobium chenweiae]AWB93609.1 WXG100 family type VII secretion target [Aeromicrobium chenweiae]TGN33259.1 WXG100 family type VII secretion target [Aeromicrobium chenweiae]
MTGSTGRLAVSFGGLGNLAGEVAAGVAKLEARLNQLDQDLTPLKGDWTGEAAASYQQAKAKWDQAIQDLKLTLSQSGQAVNDSGDDYRRTETQNASSFGG